ncbi:TerC family protein [soil metagenome]
MFGQTFVPADLAGVAALVVLEALLSADNALVLAIMVRHLPKEEQKRALLYGLGGAFFFRFLMILFATFILKQWWLQLIGGLYLLYLPIKHFITKGSKEDAEEESKGEDRGFWKTVVAVELTDVAFALDSVLAGIGFITRPGKGVMGDKIWVVFTGAIIGIVLLRFAASLFIKLLEKFPALDNVAYSLVGWVGIKLVLHAADKAEDQHLLSFRLPEMTETVFWLGLIFIIVVGSIMAFRMRREESS